MITLRTELARIHGLTPQFLEKFKKLRILTVEDLLTHFPARYEDFSKVVPIAELASGMVATVSGIVRHVESRRSWRRGMVIVEVTVRDATGSIKAIWFNQPYLARALRPGLAVNIAGRVTIDEESLVFSNPTYEAMSADGPKHTAGLIPVYPETKGLTSKGIRYLVRPLLQVMPRIPDCIPASILERFRVPDRGEAFRTIHFPKTMAEAERVKKRFAFEELFLLQMHNVKIRHALAQSEAIALAGKNEDMARIRAAIPFALTGAQERSLAEIMEDVSKRVPMNRLLQGDVGSGKTVIAIIVALLAAREGHQAAFMAPTEVLARQHVHTLAKGFAPLMKEWGINVGLLISATPKAEKRALIAGLKEGIIHIVIGTHALIEQEVVFHDLAFVVIDEQHRFGVQQRAKLAARFPRESAPAPRSQSDFSGSHQRQSAFLPHFLSMSATPIPRTLSLTLFGDLDLSIVDELPKGRKPIVTKIVAPENRNKAYAFVRGAIQNGRQAFVICPRIDNVDSQIDADDAQINADSDSPPAFLPRGSASYLRKSASWDDVKAVKEEYEKLSTKIFPDLKIGLLHGKLPSKEKAAVMQAFQKGEVQILVSTSVIEVGVDVPNATIMLIEGAERFGLSQLYQFRGRIGRGAHQSYCLLFTDSTTATAQTRLRALIAAKNGFELAEKDLAMRGPGQFLGSNQTGIPDIAMNALGDIPLIKASREAAQMIVREDPALIKYPLLKERLAQFETSLHLE